MHQKEALHSQWPIVSTLQLQTCNHGEEKLHAWNWSSNRPNFWIACCTSHVSYVPSSLPGSYQLSLHQANQWFVALHNNLYLLQCTHWLEWAYLSAHFLKRLWCLDTGQHAMTQTTTQRHTLHSVQQVFFNLCEYQQHCLSPSFGGQHRKSVLLTVTFLLQPTSSLSWFNHKICMWKWWKKDNGENQTKLFLFKTRFKLTTWSYRAAICLTTKCMYFWNVFKPWSRPRIEIVWHAIG